MPPVLLRAFWFISVPSFLLSRVVTAHVAATAGGGGGGVFGRVEGEEVVNYLPDAVGHVRVLGLPTPWSYEAFLYHSVVFMHVHLSLALSCTRKAFA